MLLLLLPVPQNALATLPDAATAAALQLLLPELQNAPATLLGAPTAAAAATMRSWSTTGETT